MNNQEDLSDNTQIRNIIAVVSGKGGVGKSTVTANLALTLKQQGYQIGILDADVYGPSQGKMLGIKDNIKPDITKKNGKTWYLPVNAYGIAVMSMAFLASERTPMVWRGPMASGAFQQMLLQTWWGQLDILLVDMPPGTGDIQLTLSQKASLKGSIVVTTPQDIALLDAQRAIEMFKKVNIPVTGIVENMSVHICSQCGHQEAIFGHGGAKRLASHYAVKLLGSLPLNRTVREHGDQGCPVVMAEDQYAKIYTDIAVNITDELNKASDLFYPPKINIDQ
ncbi:MAG: Mrp/NBP35 family ATP-binding protein [Endozoicomonadaceae bacterium]|nr:Mrp/NBP35 family ATP-binding protein [Endozoicomonadaceae bacterium]